ncbi:MAG: PEP-CTERM sorting domain-containing protein [Sedimentisphaerales bacterium]|nr:PEP-CTERM sorting domain-containing protein [Sedimentisphaerales bacterium]
MRIQKQSACTQSVRWLVVVAVLGLIGSAWGQANPVYWQGPTSGGPSGLFQNPLNWDTANVPGPGDAAIFNLGFVFYDVTFNDNATTDQLQVLRDYVNFDLCGYQYDVGGDDGQVIVGNYSGDGGDLGLTHGTLTSRSGIFGMDEGTVGSASIYDVGTVWNISDDLIVGDAGTGMMDISMGAAVTANLLTLGNQATGYGSIYLYDSDTSLNITAESIIGNGGTGLLDISDYAQATLGGWVTVDNGGSIQLSNGGVLTAQAGMTLGQMEYGHGMLLLEGNSQVILQGEDSEWKELFIGESGHCDLEAYDSSLETGKTIMGWQATGSAEAYVSGPDAVWTLHGGAGGPDSLVVGDEGDATLTIMDYGRVEMDQRINVGKHTGSEGCGEVYIIAEPLITGTAGDGAAPAVFAPNGPSLVCGGGVLGDEEGASGYVMLMGNDEQTAQWTVGLDYVNHDLIIGNFGWGGLDVYENSLVLLRERLLEHWQPGEPDIISSCWMKIGEEETGSGNVNVQGENAVLHIEHAPLVVGDGGTGYLTVSDGGLVKVENGEVFIGMGETGWGHVTVQGENTRLEDYSWYATSVGFNGSGVLEVRDGAYMYTDHLVIGENQSGQGFVQVSEASMQVGGYLTVGREGIGTLDLINGETGGPGMMTVGDADLISVLPGELHLGPNGYLQGNGEIIGSVIDKGGLLQPGASVGELTISGNYTQTDDGVLYLEIAGDQPGQYDVLHVYGDVELEGCLGLWLADGFLPQEGMTFDLVQFTGSISPQENWFDEAQWIFGLEGYSVQWEYSLSLVGLGVDGWAVRLTSENTVPEPMTLSLLALGGLILRRRKS